MAADFLPLSDSLLLFWSANFLSQAGMLLGAVGLDSSQVSAYAVAHGAFADALSTASNPATKTQPRVAEKNAQRAALKAMARNLAKVANAFPGVSNASRIALGLTPRIGTASSIQPPVDPPGMEILSIMGRTIQVKLHGTGTDLRGKPRGVAGASYFRFIGPTPPSDIAEWIFEGSGTRSTFTVNLPASIPAGSQVWLTAFWFNPRAQPGPMGTPVTVWVGGGLARAA